MPLSSPITPLTAHPYRRHRTVTRLLTGLGAGLLLALPLTAAGTLRHIRLVSSTPAKDAHVMTPVREIRLAFSGKVDVSKASVELLAADGSHVNVSALAAVADSHHVAVAKVDGALKNSTYTVRWKAVAADGAAGSGAFSFMYMAEAK